MEYELLIREAEPGDAAELVTFLNRVSVETDFTSLDREGILLTDTEMELFWINRLIQKIKSLYLPC